jgi:hypothetical protein
MIVEESPAEYRFTAKGLLDQSSGDLIELITTGLPFSELVALQKDLGLTPAPKSAAANSRI